MKRDEVADLLRVTVRTVDALIARGVIPSIRIGHSVRVDPRDLGMVLAAGRIGIGLLEIVQALDARLRDESDEPEAEPDG